MLNLSATQSVCGITLPGLSRLWFFCSELVDEFLDLRDFAQILFVPVESLQPVLEVDAVLKGVEDDLTVLQVTVVSWEIHPDVFFPSMFQDLFSCL